MTDETFTRLGRGGQLPRYTGFRLGGGWDRRVGMKVNVLWLGSTPKPGEGDRHHVSGFFSGASCPGQSVFGPASEFVSGGW